LFEKLIDERRLPVIDVRDDRDVAEVTGAHEASGFAKIRAQGVEKGGGLYGMNAAGTALNNDPSHAFAIFSRTRTPR
jgi:hypothetical protein